MPSGLHGVYGAHHLHLFASSCYRRLPFLVRRGAGNQFLSISEQIANVTASSSSECRNAGTLHLLLTEPELGIPSTVMQVLKQRTARALLPKRKPGNPRQRSLFGDKPQRRAFWQARSYDFNVWTTKKRVEKLRYMHRNPVKRGLVSTPEQWRWSSYRFYLLDEAGPVRVNEGWAEISFRNRVA